MARTKTPHSLYTLTFRHLTGKPLLPVTNYLSRLYSSPATVSHPPHPWPEWVSFVDRLKSRGYFPGSSAVNGDVDNANLVYREIKLLKEPCFSFARDRYDVFKSLSKDDIHNIVENGCPTLVRKVVNSSKRLRAYVGLEEKDVCDVCSLKESCDRAYLKSNDSESARTVDIMRLLMLYALDPILISGAVRPSSIEQAESSARRLLSMLMDLSEPSKPLASADDKIVNSTTTVGPQAVETRNLNWICPKCKFSNPSRNSQCKKCNESGPEKCGSNHVEVKKGDWHCPRCERLNFARRTKCHHCSTMRPPESLNPGEWVCSTCSYLNFRRNTKCLKCDTDHKEALS